MAAAFGKPPSRFVFLMDSVGVTAKQLQRPFRAWFVAVWPKYHVLCCLIFVEKTAGVQALVGDQKRHYVHIRTLGKMHLHVATIKSSAKFL